MCQSNNSQSQKAGRAVIILDDNYLEQCQINYFMDNQLIPIDILNKIFLDASYKNEIIDKRVWLDFNHFFERDWFYRTKYLNPSVYDKIITTKLSQHPVASSINTKDLLRGLQEMILLAHGNALGYGVDVSIKYKDKEEILAHGRYTHDIFEAKRLVYDFAYHNNLLLEGVHIRQLSFEEFSILFDYITINMHYMIFKHYFSVEEYGDALYKKIKRLNLEKIHPYHSLESSNCKS